MSYAAVHLPEFPAAAWLRGAPQLRTLPLAVLEGAPPQEKVASLNRRAKAAGVEHGMSRVQAEAVCSAVFRARQVEEEQAAFKAAVAIASRIAAFRLRQQNYMSVNTILCATRYTIWSSSPVSCERRSNAI